MRMKLLLSAGLLACGLAATSVQAAPAGGLTAAVNLDAASPVEVVTFGYGRRHCYWHHGHRHCWYGHSRWYGGWHHGYGRWQKYGCYGYGCPYRYHYGNWWY